MRSLALVLALSAFVRLWGTFENVHHTDDEPVHVPSAISLCTHGTTEFMNWTSPPLGSLILCGSISVFGDNPRGWRTGNVLLGTASVLLVYLIGLRLFAGGAVPLLAAALLGLDPFHAYYSRTTFMEIPATFFFLLYLYLMLEHSEARRRTLPLAGIALGCAMATKPYFVFAIPMVAAYSFHRSRQLGEPLGRLLGDYALTHLVLPASVLIFSYAGWFGRGYTLPEFVRLNLDAVRTLRSFTVEQFLFPARLIAGGEPWEWFLRPIVFGRQELVGGGAMGRFSLVINNPPARLLVLPAVAVVCFHGWKERSVKELLPPMLFGGIYLLILTTGRPMFNYSALAVLPIAYLILARAVGLVARWSHQERRVVPFVIGGVILWGLYTFPLISSRLVPVMPYRVLLSIARFVGGT